MEQPMDKNPEILSHAEPFLFKGGPVGCLLLHGFTGNPFEMRLLGNSLAQEGFTVLAPLFAGHGTDPQDMQRVRWWDWLANVEGALALLKNITEHQVVMGLSMGGVLALLAAARYPLDGVVSFSTPGQMPNDLRLRFLRSAYWLQPMQQKEKLPGQDSFKVTGRIDYPYYPTRSVLELQYLIDTMRQELPAVKIPALFVQSHGDHTITANSMDDLFDHVSSGEKSRLWLETSGHVIVREPEREKVFAASKQFVNRILDL
jgi:carboxylesterase